MGAYKLSHKNMSTLDEVKAAAQAVVDALAALETPTATPPTIAEVDVKESDGTEETFEPKAE